MTDILYYGCIISVVLFSILAMFFVGLIYTLKKRTIATVYLYIPASISTFFILVFSTYVLSIYPGEIEMQSWIASTFDLFSSFCVLWMSSFALSLVEAMNRKVIRSKSENMKIKLRWLLLTLIVLYIPQLLMRLYANGSIATYVNLSLMCVIGGGAGLWFYTLIGDAINISERARAGSGKQYKSLQYLGLLMLAAASGCYLMAQSFICFASTNVYLHDTFVITTFLCCWLMFVSWSIYEMQKRNKVNGAVTSSIRRSNLTLTTDGTGSVRTSQINSNGVSSAPASPCVNLKTIQIVQEKEILDF